MGIGSTTAPRRPRPSCGDPSSALSSRARGCSRLLSAAENVDVALRLLGSRRAQGEATNHGCAGVGRTWWTEPTIAPMSSPVASSSGSPSPGHWYMNRAICWRTNRPARLDTTTGAAILGLLQRWPQTGTTVVMATHDPAAINFVDRALFVSDGALHAPDRQELTLWLTDGTSMG